MQMMSQRDRGPALGVATLPWGQSSAIIPWQVMSREQLVPRLGYAQN